MNRSVDGWLAAAEPMDSERKVGDQIDQPLFIRHDMRRDNPDNAFYPRAELRAPVPCLASCVAG
ncbi:hypothetical protein [Immundisolibacter sp.]|uniref:hypothetical protein n=1 Tax=Immundisolibacter sp. TaxID=1934948 RepID=UPI00356A3BA7